MGEWREWERGWEVQVEAYHMAHEIELERGSGGATRGRARQAALTCSSCSFTVPGESGGVFVKPGLPFPHTFTMEIFREEPEPCLLYLLYLGHEVDQIPSKNHTPQNPGKRGVGRQRGVLSGWYWPSVGVPGT